MLYLRDVFLPITYLSIGSTADLVTKSKCLANEEYRRCGSACPPICSDLFYPLKPKLCTKQCVAGCFCKTGLYRTKNGDCVQPEVCCTRSNEVYKDCGTACPTTCGSQSSTCIAVCVPGCFCQDGFIRKDNSTNSPCISSKLC